MSDTAQPDQTNEVTNVKALSCDPTQYGADYTAHLLEQYKMVVEMADRISTRRQEANNFFLGIASAIVAFTALFADPVQSAESGPVIAPLGMLSIAVTGLAVSVLWFLLLGSFRTLNSAKYKVIVALEDHLPARPYAAEWEHLAYGLTSKHRTLTKIEKGVPVVFGLLYVVMAGFAVGHMIGWL
jgi:hypothetical protein